MPEVYRQIVQSPGSSTYDAQSLTVTFNADALLAPDTEYTVSISVDDILGNPTESRLTFSFRTSLADGAIATLWNDSTVPSVVDAGDYASVELGTRFFAAEAVLISGVRFYKGPDNDGPHIGSLWDDDGNLLAQTTFAAGTAQGWQTAFFDEPVAIGTDVTYIISYLAPNGGYSVTLGYFDQPHSSGLLTAPASTRQNGNGLFSYGDGGFPTGSSRKSNYWVSPIYEPVPDTQAPTVVATLPLDNASSVSLNTPLSVVLDEEVQSNSVDFVLTGDAGPITGTTSYDAPSNTITFSPASALDPGTVHSAQVVFADLEGNVPDPAFTYSFITAQPAGSIAALWNDATVPATIDGNDAQAIEVGTRFTSSEIVEITGVRFYKAPDNTGVHTGSLWNSLGVRLAQVEFVNETSTGWQQMSFDEPVRIEPGELYTISYHAPEGRYSASTNFFDEAHTQGPLTAPAAVSIGGNGVFVYGSGGFPTLSASNTNYWVSPVYATPEDLNAPTLARTIPDAGATSVAPSSTIVAVFDEEVLSASVSMSVQDNNGAAIAGIVTFDEDSNSLVFEPDAPLDSETVYSVQVMATDVLGNATAAPLTFSFTSSLADGSINALWEDSVTPDIIDSGDASSIEVGTQFNTNQDLDITGIRFFKSPANSGTHVGSLWSEGGELLGQVTFTNETPAGWQQADFDTPVRIDGGQNYVVSYYSPAGHYAVTGGYFTESFSSGPLTALSSSVGNGNGLFGYGGGGFPTGSFNASNYWVSPVYEYPPEPPTAGESLWEYTLVPDTVDSGDTNPIEVGVKFSSDQPIDILGVRFFKSTANTGDHIASLWDANGSLLAQSTVTHDDSRGWHEIVFDTPASINAGQMYVVSYHAPNGRYSASPGYYLAPHSNGPVTALSTDVSSGNGVFSYSGPGFPNSSFNSTNYWVGPIWAQP